MWQITLSLSLFVHNGSFRSWAVSEPDTVIICVTCNKFRTAGLMMLFATCYSTRICYSLKCNVVLQSVSPVFALSTAAVAMELSHTECALFHRSLSADLQLSTPRNLRKYFSTHDRALLLEYWKFLCGYCLSFLVMRMDWTTFLSSVCSLNNAVRFNLITLNS